MRGVGGDEELRVPRESAVNELIFQIQDAPEGGYTARALCESIFTEGETLDELRERIRGAIACHFVKNQAPKIVRLHFVREEVLAL